MNTEDSGPAHDGVVRVVVVDDHALFRRGMTTLLQDHGFAVCAGVGLGADALAAARAQRPDVVLMDQRLPDMSGPEVTRRILEELPLTRVLAVSASGSESDLRAALLAGAAGYLLKRTSADEIAAAVRATAAGETPISPGVAGYLVAHLRRSETVQEAVPPSAPAASLSEREREILALITAGHDNNVIAESLFISPQTVKGHVSAILRKLGVANRIQAAVHATRHGLD